MLGWSVGNGEWNPNNTMKSYHLYGVPPVAADLSLLLCVLFSAGLIRAVMLTL